LVQNWSLRPLYPGLHDHVLDQGFQLADPIIVLRHPPIKSAHAVLTLIRRMIRRVFRGPPTAALQSC